MSSKSAKTVKAQRVLIITRDVKNPVILRSNAVQGYSPNPHGCLMSRCVRRDCLHLDPGRCQTRDNLKSLKDETCDQETVWISQARRNTTAH